MKERTLHYIGWLLFLASAIFFVINSSNVLEMLAALTFLFGCIVFLVAMMLNKG